MTLAFLANSEKDAPCYAVFPSGNRDPRSDPAHFCAAARGTPDGFGGALWDLFTTLDGGCLRELHPALSG